MEAGPTRKQVRKRLAKLVAAEISREEASDWASRWLLDDTWRPGEPSMRKAIDELAGADLQVASGDYLHHEVDFRAWLFEFDNPST